MSGSASSSARKPARTSAWSSASRTEIIGGLLAVGWRPPVAAAGSSRRSPPRPGSRPPARGPALQLPAERRGPRAHPGDRRCRSPSPAPRGRRLAVVVAPGQVSRVRSRTPTVTLGRGPGPGVPAHVGQRLLHDPVRGPVHLGRQRPRRRRDRRASPAGRRPRSARPAGPGPSAGCAGRRLLLRAQHAEHRAHLAQRLRAGRLDRGQRLAGLLRAARPSGAGRRRPAR